MGWFDETEYSSCATGVRLFAETAMVHALVGNALAQTLQNPDSRLVSSSCLWRACTSLYAGFDIASYHVLNSVLLFFTLFQKVALVGENGSRKTRVIAQQQRFYDPGQIKLLLNGVEIKTFQMKWQGKKTRRVSQAPILFNETIRANIAYGRGRDAFETDIIYATEPSNPHCFISGLQQASLTGYNTMVGESRVQLSGGQAGKSRDWPYPEHVVHEALDGLWLTEPLGWWVVGGGWWHIDYQQSRTHM
ncbi:hypothetical protein HID58_014786 [Brassica napus]|uniref:ABC transporter domain-containing protein n=1 Tax=Brassica napus TaxID=3708 RepID=A0ABQ8DIA0_BRANA|nr:hypothetical protein HID58_014786 [Brassica napus]